MSDINFNSTTNKAASQSAAETITNKTIDADQNTITNIENSDIKAGADISWMKLSNATMNLNQAAPANDTDVTVPSTVRRRFVFGNVFVKPTAIVSGLIEIKITPSGGALTSVGSCYADPAADTQSNGLWYAFEVRANDKYRFVKSGGAGATENIQSYNYIDYT